MGITSGISTTTVPGTVVIFDTFLGGVCRSSADARVGVNLIVNGFASIVT